MLAKTKFDCNRPERGKVLMRRHILSVALMAFLASGSSFAAEKTWTGSISSSMCNAAHNVMDHECIMNCIKAGAKYVFVSKGQVYEIQNQDNNDLEKYAVRTDAARQLNLLPGIF